jgi:diguanylate cyclase (GGDEF)-like protein
MGVPLMVGKKCIGSMVVASYERENHFSQGNFALFTTIAAEIAFAFENARIFARMEELATSDTLTGLYNRRQFKALAAIEFERAVRYKKSMAVVMIDIDYFKKVNDNYGHAGGDLVLQSLSDLCKRSLRKVDIMGRYGGEEFVILLPETGIMEAQKTAERLRLEIAGMLTNTPKGAVRITASFGIAILDDKRNTLDSLLDCADQAVYGAKLGGRNRVNIFQDPII